MLTCQIIMSICQIFISTCQIMMSTSPCQIIMSTCQVFISTCQIFMSAYQIFMLLKNSHIDQKLNILFSKRVSAIKVALLVQVCGQPCLSLVALLVQMCGTLCLRSRWYLMSCVHAGVRSFSCQYRH